MGTMEDYKAKLNLPPRGTNKDQESLSPNIRMAEALNNVDIVLISTPMWNYSAPYVLKQYIDTIIQPGVNFSDEEQRPFPQLRGRVLVVVSSAGAVYDEKYHLQDFLNPFLKQVFGLLGFENITRSSFKELQIGLK